MEPDNKNLGLRLAPEHVPRRQPRYERQVTISDHALVAEILAGDRKAIGQFVANYSDVVYNFLYQRLHHRELADDLFQETFLAAWAGLKNFHGESTLATWLCAIARHKLADYYREQLSRPWLQDEEADDESLTEFLVSEVTVDEAVDYLNMQAKVHKILASMSDKHRLILLWRYWDESSLGDIAKTMGRTAKAVERLLARARNEFAQRWNDDEITSR